MSKFLWRSLLISPAILGATLVVSPNALAADTTDATQTATGTEAGVATTEMFAFSTESSQLGTVKVESLDQVAPVVNIQQPEVVAQIPSANLDATDNKSTIQQINRYSREGGANASVGQVTSVSQLSDVQPTDWAFQALQSLVERYGCIAGYPDGTYRGNRAMTRYEFAAGLNACLERIQELIGAATENLVTREDLAALQRLQEEFAGELASLRGRVDALEARTSELEANQFSTTTKLTGEAIFALSGTTNSEIEFEVPPPKGVEEPVTKFKNENESVFQQRVRLNLNTSFNGKDLLFTRLQVGNAERFALGITSEGTQTYQVGGDTGNTVSLAVLYYKFPLTRRINVTMAATGAGWDDIVPTVNPYFEDYDGGNGALSAFAQRNPIYRLGGGAGIGVDYAFGGRGLLGGVFGPTSLSFGYLSATAADPSENNGVFGCDYSVLAQLTFTPSQNLQFAFTYNHARFNDGNFGFDNGALLGGEFTGFTGTGYANTVNGLSSGVNRLDENLQPIAKGVASNSYGFNASWRLSPKFIVGGWVGYTTARVIGVTDARIWNYAITLAFPDLFKQGNLGGIVVGREPYLESVSNDSFDNFPDCTSLHVEGFYKFQLSDNISLTPGVIWISNPNQSDKNDDLIIGTLRTTFTF